MNSTHDKPRNLPTTEVERRLANKAIAHVMKTYKGKRIVDLLLVLLKITNSPTVVKVAIERAKKQDLRPDDRVFIAKVEAMLREKE